MAKPVRQWDQTAPTLLWAHQIRRENIHLVDQIDRTRTDLASTTTTTNNVKKSVTDLEQRIQVLSSGVGDLEKKLDQVDGRATQRLEALSSLLESSREENIRLKERLEGAEKVFHDQSRLMKGTIRDEVMAEMRMMLGRELSSIRCGVVVGITKTTENEPDLVPDSIPMDEANPPLERKYLEQQLTQATFGDPSEYDEQSLSHDGNELKRKHNNQPETDLHRLMKQNGRGLAEYFSFAESTRMKLPPRRREGLVVEAVVAGLDDLKVRDLLERQMDDAGWSWDVLAALLRGMVREQERKTFDIQSAEAGTVHATTNGTAVKPRQRKRRRFIPIVPADDEDDLI
ncbi:hypothetical protein AWENTII_012569 [Aspergillus wentii]|nr:hypothetical protein MW887_002639 [Aspergillus wentii]